jgi:iron complex transport system ATP-binding protein
MIKFGHIRFERKEFCMEIEPFEMQPKQKVAILGENGSGKSTFIHYACGLLGKGEVEYNSRKLRKIKHEDRAKLFALFAQNPDVVFPFTVLDVVRMGRYASSAGGYTGSDDEKTMNTLRLFDIERYAKRKFTELSGGEKRRVMLARAFNQNTPILYLDEPVSMLDIRHSLEIMQIIEDTDKTIIASMHDINLSAKFFDRLIFMKDGKILHDVMQKDLRPEIIEEVYNVKVTNSNAAFDFII